MKLVCKDGYMINNEIYMSTIGYHEMRKIVGNYLIKYLKPLPRTNMSQPLKYDLYKYVELIEILTMENN